MNGGSALAEVKQEIDTDIPRSGTGEWNIAGSPL